MTPAAMRIARLSAARPKLRAAARPGLVGRSIDAAVRAVSPSWYLRRQNARVLAALGDGFDAVSRDRTRRHQSHRGGSADDHLDETTLWRLRELCRAADRQSPLIHGILSRWVDNVLGPTWTFEPRTSSKRFNASAKSLVADAFGPSLDIRGVLPARRLARLWLRAVGTDGDTLGVWTERGVATYEADQLVTPYRQSEGRRIVHGVHVDPVGRPLGYYVGDRSWRGMLTSLDDAAYIPASECFRPAYYTRHNQTRGVPLLAAGMGLFDHLDGYLDSEQIAAEVASGMVYTITRADPSFFLDEGGELPDWVTSETSADGTAQQLEKAEPGQIIPAALGDKVDLLNPARPGASFEPYVITTLRMLGAGLGMPLELVLLDFSRTNYSSARAALLQAYRTFRCWQQFCIEEILGPLYRRVVGRAIVDGRLPLRTDAFAVRWLMPRWAWIDPLKEIVAAEKAVSMGIDTLTDRIEDERQTLSDYIDRRKAELDAFAAAGIPSTTIPAPPPAQEAPA